MTGLLHDSNHSSSRNLQGPSGTLTPKQNSISGVLSEARSFSLHKSVNLNNLGGADNSNLKEIHEMRNIKQIKMTIKEIIPNYSMNNALNKSMKTIGFVDNGRQHLDQTVDMSALHVNSKMTYT